MKRLILTLAVLLLILVASIWLLLENPDRFKDEISGVIESGTDYQVQFNGDLSWRYWPPIAIEATNVSIADHTGAEFASFENLQIDLDLIPVLTQGTLVDINVLSISGGEINLPSASIESEPSSSNPDTGSTGPTPVIHEFVVNETHVLIQPGLQLTINALGTSRLGHDIPFDVTFDGSFSHELVDTRISGAGRLLHSSDTGRVAFTDILLSTDATIDGTHVPPFQVKAEGEWRRLENTLTLRQAELSMNALLVSLTGLATLDPLRFDGVIDIESPSLPVLARIIEATSPFDALQLKSDIQATAGAISLRAMEMKLDESLIQGQLAYWWGDAPRIKTDLRIDQFNLMASHGEEAQLATPLPGAEPKELIPLPLLQTTVIDAIIRIGNLTTESAVIKDAKLELHNNKEIAGITANATAHGGKLVMNANIALADTPETHLTMNADSLDLTSLTASTDLTGQLSGHSRLQFTGTTNVDLYDSIKGQTIFDIEKGSISVVPIKSMAQTIDLIRGKRSRISDWPDVLPFEQMTGEHRFTKGMPDGQLLQGGMEHVDFLLLGGMDLQSGTLDYDVTVRFKKKDEGPFRVSEQLAGIRWPLKCRGPLDATVAELCFSNEGAISTLVQEIIRQDVERRGKNKIKEAIEDKLPDNLKGITDEIFKGIFD